MGSIQTFHAISFEGIFLLILLLLLLKSVMSPAGAPSVCRVRKRHVAIRVICGLAGSGLLAAIGVATGWDILQPYKAAENVRLLTLHVPAGTAPALPNAPGETKRTRALLQMVFIKNAPDIRPVYARTFTINWPEDRGKEFEDRFDHNGLAVNYRFHISSLQATLSGESPLTVMGHASFTSERYHISASSVGRSLHFPSENKGVLARFGTGRWPSSPFSIISRSQGIIACSFVTPVAQDDPLREVSLTELVERHRQALASIAAEETRAAPRARDSELAKIPIPSVRLAGHIPLATVLLLAATALLSQLFTHRRLAFVAVLALVILYVATLDRITLAVNLSKLRGPQTPIDVRLIACDEIPHTFFYRKTALKEINAVMRVKDTPEVLTSRARKVRDELLH